MSTQIGRGRNDRCPCGSGLKYKKCCLAKDEQQQREQAEFDARWNTEVWYPKASDLQLPDVPENLRDEVRAVLKRALPLMFARGVSVRANWCWQIAQSLTATAIGDLGYVEGVWTRAPGNQLYVPKRDKEDIAAHAWNSFHGHVIDLMAEFYNWQSSGEDSPWFHEPLKEYSLEELRDSGYFDDQINAIDSLDISSGIWLENGGHESLPEHLKEALYGDIEFDTYIDQVVFKDAKECLLARINAQEAQAA